MTAAVSSPRRWLAQYPPGVAADLDLSRDGCVIDRFDASFAKYADQPACVIEDLQKTNVGKILRRELRDEAMKRMGC